MRGAAACVQTAQTCVLHRLCFPSRPLPRQACFVHDEDPVRVQEEVRRRAHPGCKAGACLSLLCHARTASSSNTWCAPSQARYSLNPGTHSRATTPEQPTHPQHTPRVASQACIDLISFASRKFPDGVVPLERLSDACHIFLRHREHPGDRHADMSDAGAAAAAVGGERDFAPGFTARGREEPQPGAAADDEYLFNAGAILFTQFYRERNREIRLAFVCG
jgi:hypothetical protein